jgi:hypothetical protein
MKPETEVYNLHSSEPYDVDAYWDAEVERNVKTTNKYNVNKDAIKIKIRNLEYWKPVDEHIQMLEEVITGLTVLSNQFKTEFKRDNKNNLSNLSLEELIELIKKDNKEAKEELLDRYLRLLESIESENDNSYDQFDI